MTSSTHARHGRSATLQARGILIALALLAVAPPASGAGPADCGLARDAADAPTSADALTLPFHRCVGEMGGGDNEDVYAVEIAAGDDVFVIFEQALTASGSASLCVYLPDVDLGDPQCALGSAGLFEFEAPQTGTYRFRVHNNGGAPRYALTLAARQQEVSGSTLVGTGLPVAGAPSGVNGALGPGPADGVDGRWVLLASTATGAETAQFQPQLATISFVRVHYFDAARAPLGEGACSTPAQGRTCTVLAGARWALVQIGAGQSGAWTLTYAY